MKKIRIVAVLLSLLILFSFLSGCNDGASDASSQPSVEPTESSVDVQPESSEEISEEISEVVEVDGREPYKNALEAFEELENFELGVEMDIYRVFGTEKQREVVESTYRFLGYGSKEQSSRTTTKYNYGDKIAEYELISLDGADFLDYGDEKFCSEQAEGNEAYFLDPELYGKIIVSPESADKEEKVLLFTEAEAVEEWIAYDYATLVSAEAEVYLNAEGMITGYKYTVAYNHGAVYNEIEYKAVLAPYSDDELPTIERPANVREYTEVESVEAVILLDRALMNLERMEVYTLSRNVLWLDQVSSRYEESNGQIYYFEYGDEFAENLYLHKVREIYNPNKRDFDTYDTTNETTIIDGKKTVKVGKKETEHDMSDSDIKEHIEATAKDRMSFSPELSHISEISYDAIEGYITITVLGNREYGKMAYELVCDYLESDEDTIDEYFDGYVVEQAEYMITIDVDTYYPVAVNFDFSAMHESDIKELKGYEYEIGVESRCSYSPALPDTYFEITEEQHPDFDTEPENEEKAKPLFYKVTDANGKTMWLLGTIHVGDNRTAYLPDEIYEALNGSDALAVEVDTIALGEEFEDEDNDDLFELYREAYCYEDNDTLKKNIDEKLYRDTVDYAKRLGLGFYGDYMSASSEFYRPNYWSGALDNIVSEHTYGVYYHKGVDRRLLGLAKEKEIKVYEVEDRYRQYTMDIDYSDETLELILNWTVYASRSQSYSDTMELFDAWCKGDYDELYALVNEEYDTSNMTEDEIKAYEEYMKALQEDRDALMLKKAKKYLESGETVFYAVGLAHLLNEDGGLVFKLAEAGYTVELVEYK